MAPSLSNLVHTQEQNGVTERKHHHIFDTTRALLISASVPRFLWAEALLTAVFLINITPSSIIADTSPHFRLFKSHFRYSLLRTFGCVCFVLLPTSERDKLSPRTARCIFLGYNTVHKGYRCYESTTRRLRIARHVTFFENVPYYATSDSDLSFLQPPSSPSTTTPVPLAPVPSSAQPISSFTPLASGNHPLESSTPSELPLATSLPLQDTHSVDVPSTPVPVSPDVIPPRRNPPRDRHPPARYAQCATSTYSSEFVSFLAAIHSIHEPNSYSEAVKYPEWQHAMNEELEAFHKTHTWDLVPLPSNVKPISCKWIYKVKTRSDGSIERYKARLVARGFSQEYGIDYEETFAPVAKMTSIRTVIAVAATKHWSLYQMDVKNAFLHGDLSETVYMQPPGFSAPAGHVCKLSRAMYGLK